MMRRYCCITGVWAEKSAGPAGAAGVFTIAILGADGESPRDAPFRCEFRSAASNNPINRTFHHTRVTELARCCIATM